MIEIANCSAVEPKKQIDQASDHHANQAHEQKCAEPCQIALGRVAPEAHTAEHNGGNKKGAPNAHSGEGHENRCHGHAHDRGEGPEGGLNRSEEHTPELQSLMRNSYAVFCLKKKKET